MEFCQWLLLKGMWHFDVSNFILTRIDAGVRLRVGSVRVCLPAEVALLCAPPPPPELPLPHLFLSSKSMPIFLALSLLLPAASLCVCMFLCFSPFPWVRSDFSSSVGWPDLG